MSAHNTCNCLSVSRRNFLTIAAGSVAVPLAAAEVPPPEKRTDLGEYIDIASFRPKPRVRILSAVIRAKPPYWLGWPGTSYKLEEMRKEYGDTFAAQAQSVGVELAPEAAPLESDEAVNGFVQKVKTEKPDAVLVMIQHLGVWHWADAIARAGVPTIIFSPIGTAFTGQVRDISRRAGVHVISSLETAAVEQAMRMIRTKRQFEESRLLVVAGDKRNETVLERLGTKVRYVPRSTLHELFAHVPANDEAHDVAKRMSAAATKIVEPTPEDFLNAARSYMAAKRLMRDESATAITTDCLGMVSTRVVPTPPCMAATIFQDSGCTYGCEADVFGAISLMFTSFLFDRPGYMNDPVAETVKNHLVTAHCVSGTRLNGFSAPAEPHIWRSHSESNIGVSAQVLFRVGQAVSLVRFQNPNEVIVDTGTVAGNVNTPPAGGCRTSVEIEMDRIEDVRDVLGFHQVVSYGNHRRAVGDFCQMYGLTVINSPERAPRSA